MYTIPGFNFSFGTPKFTDLTSTFSNATFKIDPTFKGFDYTPTSLLNLTGKKVTPITDVPRQSFPAGSGVPSFTPTTKFYSKSLGKTLTAQEVMAMGSVAASVMQTPLANYIKNLNLTPVEETNFQTAPNKKIEDASKNFGDLLNQKAATSSTTPTSNTPKAVTPIPFDTSKIQPEYEDIAGLNLFAVRTRPNKGLSKQGETIKKLAEQYSQEAYGILHAISGAEGTLRPSKENKGQKTPGYNVMFGGGTFSDLSRHPNKVVRSPGGYASDAAGAFQFKQGTYKEAMQRLGLSGFTQEEQNLAALQKIHERTQKLGGLPAVLKEVQQKGLTPRIQAALSPEWASFPTERGVSAYGQPVKPAKAIQQFYQQGVDTYRKLMDRPQENKTSSVPVPVNTSAPATSAVNSTPAKKPDSISNAISAVQAVNRYKEIAAQTSPGEKPVFASRESAPKFIAQANQPENKELKGQFTRVKYDPHMKAIVPYVDPGEVLLNAVQSKMAKPI